MGFEGSFVYGSFQTQSDYNLLGKSVLGVLCEMFAFRLNRDRFQASGRLIGNYYSKLSHQYPECERVQRHNDLLLEVIHSKDSTDKTDVKLLQVH